MRTDSLMIGSIKQNQLISIILIVVGIGYLVFKYIKIKPEYYIYYLDVDFEPVINKETCKVILKEEKVIVEQVTEEVIEEKEEPKEENIEVYEVPEELDKNAPFRKSKYIVDDSDEE